MAMASTSMVGLDNTTTSDSSASCLRGMEALRLKRAGPVRRNLFGPVDHQQLQRDFQRLLCMGVEAANQRWDFDFRNDVPREGSGVEWEELRCQDVPMFYRSGTVVKAKAQRRGSMSSSYSSNSTSSSSDSEGSPNSSSSSGSGEEYLEVTTRGRYRLKRLGKHKQSTITDFFMVKKRRLHDYKGPSRQ